MAQFRLVDVAKRQLKTPPDARDVSWSIRKREILAKHKVRFATQPDEREMAYYNLKRKHVIGFDRLASRLPSRGIGAHQNDNGIINRLVYRTITHKMMLGLLIPIEISSYIEISRFLLKNSVIHHLLKLL